jgi:hypothetical protein
MSGYQKFVSDAPTWGWAAARPLVAAVPGLPELDQAWIDRHQRLRLRPRRSPTPSLPDRYAEAILLMSVITTMPDDDETGRIDDGGSDESCAAQEAIAVSAALSATFIFHRKVVSVEPLILSGSTFFERQS